MLLCVAISLSVTACYDDKDDADDNRYEVGTNCDCADIVALLTNKIEEMEAQLEEYKSEIVSIQTQLNNFSGGGQALPQLANLLYESQETVDGEVFYDKDTLYYEYDDNGRIIKAIANYGGDSSDVYNITYSENKCIITMVYTGGYEKYTLTLKDNEIDNLQAVNYLIMNTLDATWW